MQPKRPDSSTEPPVETKPRRHRCVMCDAAPKYTASFTFLAPLGTPDLVYSLTHDPVCSESCAQAQLEELQDSHVGNNYPTLRPEITPLPA